MGFPPSGNQGFGVDDGACPFVGLSSHTETGKKTDNLLWFF
jgi:hypothetical protein